MSKFLPTINSFIAGELSPLLYGRFDLEQYYNGAKTIENFIVLPYGGVSKFPGTYFVAPAKYSDKTAVLLPFKFNVEQAYMLEFGHQYIRFFMNNGQIMETAQNITGATNANPVVITCASHGYSSGDEVLIEGVGGMAEINDKRFIVTNPTTNTFELYDREGNSIDGTGYGTYTSGGTCKKVYEISSPYQEEDLAELKFTQNADVMWITHPNYKTQKLSRTGHTSWTLADYSPTNDPFVHNSWAASTAYSEDDYVIPTTANGYYYRCITAGTSGITEPTWPTTIGDTVTDGTVTWRCEFDKPCNYPACATFHEQRLFFGYTRAHPQRVWATKSGDFEDMTTGSSDDDALQYTLGTNEVNVIRWLAATRVLAIGTSGGALTMGSNSATSPLTPTNVMVHRENNDGAYSALPALIGSYIYYIHRDGKRVMQLNYDYNSDSYLAIDLSILAEHITGQGIKKLIYQQSPYSMLFALRNDGQLAILTRNVEQRITAWYKTSLNGTIESIDVIPRGDGDYDEVWLIVKRTINGVTKRYVEYLTAYDFGSDVADAFYLESGLTYSGSSVTTVSGLDHLEGETVSILTDGAVHPDKTVSNGSVSLEWPASKIHVGLGYTSTLEMMDLALPNKLSSIFGKIKRIYKAVISFYNTVGGQIGVGSNMDEILFRDPSMNMDEAVPLFTGFKIMNIPYGYDREISLKIQQAQPLPMSVRAVGVSSLVSQDR